MLKKIYLLDSNLEFQNRIPKDIGLIDTKATDLILKRVSNWPKPSKNKGRE